MFNFEEENMIEDFLNRRAKLGCGFNFEQLQKLMQEILSRQVMADPTRVTGYEHINHLPTMSFVYRFVRRSSLALRSTMELDMKRAAITPDQITHWIQHVKDQVLSLPGMADAIEDSQRIFNVVSVRSALKILKKCSV